MTDKQTDTEQRLDGWRLHYLFLGDNNWIIMIILSAFLSNTDQGISVISVVKNLLWVVPPVGTDKAEDLYTTDAFVGLILAMQEAFLALT